MMVLKLVVKTEREADAFASAFLFPRKSFAREFPSCITSRGTIDWKNIQPKVKMENECTSDYLSCSFPRVY